MASSFAVFDDDVDKENANPNRLGQAAVMQRVDNDGREAGAVALAPANGKGGSAGAAL